ncbi:MAG: tRNA (adenosine(37)-N6)-threonylcarbamoyltransferase complex transferase subunit TsaD [Planctomycetes bacterium]|nr:tRNA (adenosine(37)-N6)-threonylcarbamoyltransferase complex transferase subunit TsaD [Planctomycetota bacterium]
MKDLLCLGIETSCDETAAAVVRGGVEVLSNVVRTQVEIHRIFGGVVPEIACRAHAEAIGPVVDKALADAGVKLDAVGVIAVTSQPGLIGALLIGVSAAKALALGAGKPIVGVDHIAAHLYANRLVHPDLPYPNVGLVVSGGHTALYHSTGPADHEKLGATRDDAAGEAFDKVAKIMGLGYPGGPLIDRMARDGNAKAVAMPRLDDGGPDFSFSGVKTAVLYKWKGQNAGKGKRPKAAPPRPKPEDLAASFQEAVVDALVSKTLRAAAERGVKAVAVGGGVACNSRLRERMGEACHAAGLRLYVPPVMYCTDNAAMVAGLGSAMFGMGRVSTLELDAVATV